MWSKSMIVVSLVFTGSYKTINAGYIPRRNIPGTILNRKLRIINRSGVSKKVTKLIPVSTLVTEISLVNKSCMSNRQLLKIPADTTCWSELSRRQSCDTSRVNYMSERLSNERNCKSEYISSSRMLKPLDGIRIKISKTERKCR